jgi:hypothetical protein
MHSKTTAKVLELVASKATRRKRLGEKSRCSKPQSFWADHF